jgi:mono/diheme cytochrome c family protein
MPACVSRSVLVAACVFAASACRSPAAIDAPGPAVALPSGEGREILVSQCLNCHELNALELFSGFYNQNRWRSLVITMRENGAEIDDREVEVLAAYLARHFGTGAD